MTRFDFARRIIPAFGPLFPREATASPVSPRSPAHRHLALFLLLGLGLFLPACSHAEPPEESAQGKAATKTPLKSATATAYFAGGCFWGVEHFLEALDGVARVESGYMGGHVDNPTYKQVSYTDTGHAETVRVRYDPKRITYEALAKRFFEIHDPTQVNRQGPDVGKQYRSAIFTSSPEETATVRELIGKLKARGYVVVTQLIENKGLRHRFWPAETYHQDYYRRTGKQPYCHTPVPRFDRDAR